MEILSPFVALCGEIQQSPVDSQRASNAEIWCFFDVSPNKLFNKPSSGERYKMPRLSCDTTGRTAFFVIAVADVLGPVLPGFQSIAVITEHAETVFF